MYEENMYKKESSKRKAESEVQEFKNPAKKVRQKTLKTKSHSIATKVSEKEKKKDTLKDPLKPAEPWLVKEIYSSAKANDDKEFKTWFLSAKSLPKIRLGGARSNNRRKYGYSRTEVEGIFDEIILSLIKEKHWDDSKTISVETYSGINLDFWKKGGDKLSSKSDFIRLSSHL